MTLYLRSVCRGYQVSKIVLHRMDAAEDGVRCHAKRHAAGWASIEMDQVKFPYKLCSGCFREDNPIQGRPQGNTLQRNTTTRTCLKCSNAFGSRSKFNRLCSDCNEENLMVSGTTYTAVSS